MRVDLSGGDGRVAEECLDFENVHIVRVKERRESVSQLVRAEPIFEDPGHERVLSNNVFDHAPRKTISEFIEEERGAGRVLADVQIIVQNREDEFVERDDPFL